MKYFILKQLVKMLSFYEKKKGFFFVVVENEIKKCKPIQRKKLYTIYKFSIIKKQIRKQQ